jgi:3-oxoacyl-[acyl-carrier-protein] synthase II
MERRRTAVTGLGAITATGKTAEEYWRSCLAGKVGIRTITRFDPSDFASKVAGEIDGFTPEDYMERVEANRMDRSAQLAIAASDMAVADAGLGGGDIDSEKVGVLIGSGIGGIGTFEIQHARLLNRGPSRVSPYFVPMMIVDMAAGLVSIRHGFKGPNFAVVSACASGAHAIGTAFRMIERGEADMMLVGAAEASVTPMTLAGFCAMKALSTRNDDPATASRPFDVDRDGFVLGEGAGMLVLEEMGHAAARGARIYAELAGYGATGDAYHMTAPSPDGEGAVRSMRLAISDAGLAPGDISYINAHGTSTPHNDRIETAAVKSLFGEKAYEIPISATKSMVGHLLGGAGAVELIASALSIRDGRIHPTASLQNPDPECDLDYVSEGARDVELRAVLSNSFGFGGHNASIVLKAPEA